MSLVFMTFGIGLVLVGFGLVIWRKEKIEFIHNRHYRNVKDRKGYTKALGITIMFMGTLMLVSGTLALMPSLPHWLGTLVLYSGIGISVVTLLVIQHKFNGNGKRH